MKMSTASTTRPRTISHYVKKLAIPCAGIVAVLASIAAGTNNAGAWSVSGTEQQAQITVPYNNVSGWSALGSTALAFNSFTAARSPLYPNSTQRICADIQVFKTGVSPSWTYDPVYGDKRCGTFAPGSGPAYFAPYSHRATAGLYYTARIVYTWEVNGVTIGWRMVDFNHVSDYSCNQYVSNNICGTTGFLGRGAIWLGF
jgi:hypothetical protein